MSDTPESDLKTSPTSTINPNIPVDSSNLNKTDICKGTDNHNLNTKTESKIYDSKLHPLTVPPNLNVDPQNYLLRCGRDDRENENCRRPRSLSLSDGTVTSERNSIDKTQLSSRQQSVSTNPLNLDMFCVTETVNSLSTLESSEMVFDVMPIVPYPSEDFELINPTTPATLGCARTLSFHSFLCTCQLSCCCMCDSLFPPDCDACLLGVCIHLTTTHLCQRTIDIFPTVFSLKDKVC